MGLQTGTTAPETIAAASQETIVQLPYDAAIQFLGIRAREVTTHGNPKPLHKR